MCAFSGKAESFSADLTLLSNDAAAYYSEARQQGRPAWSQALLFCMLTVECLGDSRGEKVYGNFSGTFAAPGKDPRIPWI